MSIPSIIGAVAYIVIAPFLGGLLAGLDRKISARMQHRVGPPVLQPFYDVGKLLSKERASSAPPEHVYVAAYLVSCVLAGAFFFAGANFLLCVFTLTLGSLFFILAGSCTRSPYAEVGASREMLQVMSYEPMVIITAVGLYLATGTFEVSGIAACAHPAIACLPLVFCGFLVVLTTKLRKSPFDVSMAQHAHQEIVRGIVTEMSGPTLARVEVAHWYENVLFLGWTGLFVIWQGWAGLVCAIVVVFLVYILEILVDNNFARVKWGRLLSVSWWTTFVLGSLNLALVPVLVSLIG